MYIYNIGLEVENARIIPQWKLPFPKTVRLIERQKTNDNILTRHKVSERYIIAASSRQCEISSNDGLWMQLNAFYQFSRPHTIFGTVSAFYFPFFYFFIWKKMVVNMFLLMLFLFFEISQIIGISSVSILPIKSLADISPIFFVGLLKVKFG